MTFLLLILLNLSAHASLCELFGPSAGSIAIASQAEKESAANNYHAAALLGYSKTTQFSFNTFYVSTDFKEIKNVVVKNETTTVDTFKRGNAEVNPTPTAMFGIHFSTPLFAPEGPKFNISVIAPFDRLMETDTGDPYQPRYVMYENRFIRPNLIFSGSQSFGDWAFSAGVQTGIQSNGETYFVTKTTAGTPSVGKMSFNAKPSIAALASVSKITSNHVTFLSFQQEMKSNLQNRASGETEVAGSASIPFDFDVSSLLYYDPLTIRLGHQIHFEDHSSFFFTTEFQQWDSYDGSSLKLKKRGGTITGSNDYERLKLRNLFIPKIGYSRKLSEKWTGKVGYFYRQSPLKTENLKHSGNSIDVDKHVASAGAAYLFKFYQKDIILDLAYQLHLLRSQHITKTPGLETGNPPSAPSGSDEDVKIGSPGYSVGGKIHVVSLGLSWKY